MNELEQRVQALEERNKAVESNKTWESSWARKLSIITLTYIFACLFFYMYGSGRWYLDALLPTTGYLLSTLGLDFARKLFRSDS